MQLSYAQLELGPIYTDKGRYRAEAVLVGDTTVRLSLWDMQRKILIDPPIDYLTLKEANAEYYILQRRIGNAARRGLTLEPMPK